MPVSSLPMQCTCFIYDGLKYIINEDFNLNNEEMGKERLLLKANR